MTSITINAPAKVNLFLKVLNKRKDGYHNILTLFERISLADKITISKIPEGIVVSSDKFVTRSPKDNLVYRAAELILRIGVKKGQIKGNKGVRIRVKKKIPIAAGLGGGSSDAAAALIGMNRLYRLGLKRDRLAKLGRMISADVPFFIAGDTFAMGRGKGDILRKCHIRLKLYHLIIYSGFKVATKGIYEAYDSRMRGLTPRRGRFCRSYSGSSTEHWSRYLTTRLADVKISRLLTNARDLSSVESMLRNNLEDVVVAKKPVIGRIIERLAHTLDKKAIVSGSGPSVFCLYRTRKEAMEARKMLLGGMTAGEKKRWQIFIAETTQI